MCDMSTARAADNTSEVEHPVFTAAEAHPEPLATCAYLAAQPAGLPRKHEARVDQRLAEQHQAAALRRVRRAPNLRQDVGRQAEHSVRLVACFTEQTAPSVQHLSIAPKWSTALTRMPLLRPEPQHT